MKIDAMKLGLLPLTVLTLAGCTQASRSGAAEICGETPICFRAEGMITPTGATDAPGPYTLVADVVSDQAIGWVRVSFRRTRLGEVQAQENFELTKTESGLYIGTLDGRSGDVLHYRLDTVQAGSEDLTFWPGPDDGPMLTLRLLLPGEVLDAGATGGSAGDGGMDAGPGDATLGPMDAGPGPAADSGPLDAG